LPKKKKKAPRTRKQIAAAKRNIKKAIAASKKARRNLGHKANKKRRSRSGSHMPKKKKSKSRGKSKKSFIDRIPILNNPTVQKVGFGLGMGVVVADIIQLAARFAPPQISGPLTQNQGLIKLGVELATEPLSAVVDVALNPGQLSGVTNRFTGGNSVAAQGNMVGFA